mmetsp:Transcript_40636/g.123037  ORF Transcript_40636/g.123037 Transcript_40636/m.123037 type:complete len:206 (+) Transcript_40636:1-618(+)
MTSSGRRASTRFMTCSSRRARRWRPRSRSSGSSWATTTAASWSPPTTSARCPSARPRSPLAPTASRSSSPPCASSPPARPRPPAAPVRSAGRRRRTATTAWACASWRCWRCRRPCGATWGRTSLSARRAWRCSTRPLCRTRWRSCFAPAGLSWSPRVSTSRRSYGNRPQPSAASPGRSPLPAWTPSAPRGWSLRAQRRVSWCTSC